MDRRIDQGAAVLDRGQAVSDAEEAIVIDQRGEPERGPWTRYRMCPGEIRLNR